MTGGSSFHWNKISLASMILGRFLLSINTIKTIICQRADGNTSIALYGVVVHSNNNNHQQSHSGTVEWTEPTGQRNRQQQQQITKKFIRTTVHEPSTTRQIEQSIAYRILSSDTTSNAPNINPFPEVFAPWVMSSAGSCCGYWTGATCNGVNIKE